MSYFGQKNSLRLIPGSGKKKATFSLKLTSLIDMMTILLVFLLKSYSAEGQIMNVSRDLRLPESTAEKIPKVASVVALTRDWVMLDGKPILEISQVVKDKKRIWIPVLKDELTHLRKLTEGIGALSEDMSGFTGDITIQGDKDTQFEIIKKVMFTCGQVGFNNMMLAVTKVD